MTRPDPAAVCTGSAGALWAGVCVMAGWTIAAGIFAGIAAAAVILFWRVPEKDNSDIEALIRATREWPDYVPDEWVNGR